MKGTLQLHMRDQNNKKEIQLTRLMTRNHHNFKKATSLVLEIVRQMLHSGNWSFLSRSCYTLQTRYLNNTYSNIINLSEYEAI